MKFSQHSWHKRWQYSKVKENKCWIARISRYNTKHEQVCVERKAIEWSMITQIIEGKDGISHQEFNWYPWGARNVDDDHDNFCREVSWRCNRSAMTSSQRNDEAKGYWTQGYDTNSKPSSLFKEKWYDEEDRRKLSSLSKVVLREKGPGSTVKIIKIVI